MYIIKLLTVTFLLLTFTSCVQPVGEECTYTEHFGIAYIKEYDSSKQTCLIDFYPEPRVWSEWVKEETIQNQEALCSPNIEEDNTYPALRRTTQVASCPPTKYSVFTENVLIKTINESVVCIQEDMFPKVNHFEYARLKYAMINFKLLQQINKDAALKIGLKVINPKYSQEYKINLETTLNNRLKKYIYEQYAVSNFTQLRHTKDLDACFENQLQVTFEVVP